MLIGIAAAIGIFGAFTYAGTSYRRVVGARKITMDHIFNGTFYAQGHHLNWVPEGLLFISLCSTCRDSLVGIAGDGVYSESEGGYIRLVDLKNGVTTNLVATRDVKDVRPPPTYLTTLLISHRKMEMRCTWATGKSHPT